MLGPVIEGKLAMLRPPRPDDAPVMIGWFEDMEVTRFMALHHPPSLEMEKEWLERMARSPDDVVWAIEHQGRPVGASAIHARLTNGETMSRPNLNQLAPNATTMHVFSKAGTFAYHCNIHSTMHGKVIVA